MSSRRRFAICTGTISFVVAAVALAADYNTAVKSTPITTWTRTSPVPQLAKDEPGKVAKEIDKLLVEDLAAADPSTKVIELGHRTGDEVFLRRVYLDLVGRNPSPDQVTAFVLDPSADKRGKLIDKLLDDERFGENWGRYWRDVIMYHRSDERGQQAAPALYEYLRGEFNKNTPWDQIVRSFITATGDVTEKGETALIMAQFGNTSDITSEVSRIFLGVQIQCANCHDHKTDRWKREQFHQLAAFFPRISVTRSPPPAATKSQTPAGVQLRQPFVVAGNDSGRGNLRPNANMPRGTTEHFMPDLKRPELQGTRMQPVFFLTGQKLDIGTPDAKRRETIAFWMTAPTNEWFAKAFVNRIWGELVGEGFYEPIDDIGPDRTCSAPKTIDALAHEFADSKFDIKRLYCIIAATDAYQRESRSRRNPNELPFAANCPQRLRGDQLYDALVAALGMNESGPFGRRGMLPAAAQGKGLYRGGPRAQFDQVFGFDPSIPRDEVTGSIPQALLMMNSQQINREINGTGRGTDLGKLLSSTSDNDAATTELYLRCLGREPNAIELKTCLAHVKQSKNRAEGFEDILWVLVNSTEFLHRK